MLVVYHYPRCFLFFDHPEEVYCLFRAHRFHYSLSTMNPLALCLRAYSARTLGWCVVLAVLLLPAPSAAQLVNGRFITSFTTWEKYDTVGVSSKIARAFQSLIFDVGSGNFAVHTHFQAAASLRSPADEEYRLYYLYGKWKDPAGLLDVSLGRLPFFEGVGMGTLDGGLAAAHLWNNRVRFSFYGGATIPEDVGMKGWGPLKHNFTTGAHLVLVGSPELRGSLSYFKRWRERQSYWTIRPDPLNGDPIPFFAEPEPTKEQYASGDISYRFQDFRFYGRYDYNLDGKKMERGQAGLRYNMSDRVNASFDFYQRSPHVSSGSFFSMFSLLNSREYELSADYFVTPEFRAFVRGAYVEYPGGERTLLVGGAETRESFAADHTTRYTVGVAMQDNINLMYRGSTGYSGELGSLVLSGAVRLLDGLLIPNAAVSYTSYRLNAQAARQHAVSGILGATVRPSQAVSIDVQGQYLNNIVYKSDLRLFARLNVWFSEQLHILE